MGRGGPLAIPLAPAGKRVVSGYAPQVVAAFRGIDIVEGLVSRMIDAR
jgi:hypothetical protein